MRMWSKADVKNVWEWFFGFLSQWFCDFMIQKKHCRTCPRNWLQIYMHVYSKGLGEPDLTLTKGTIMLYTKQIVPQFTSTNNCFFPAYLCVTFNKLWCFLWHLCLTGSPDFPPVNNCAIVPLLSSCCVSLFLNPLGDFTNLTRQNISLRPVTQTHGSTHTLTIILTHLLVFVHMMVVVWFGVS